MKNKKKKIIIPLPKKITSLNKKHDFSSSLSYESSDYDENSEQEEEEINSQINEENNNFNYNNIKSSKKLFNTILLKNYIPNLFNTILLLNKFNDTKNISSLDSVSKINLDNNEQNAFIDFNLNYNNLNKRFNNNQYEKSEELFNNPKINFENNNINNFNNKKNQSIKISIDPLDNENIQNNYSHLKINKINNNINKDNYNNLKITNKMIKN